MRMTNSFQMPKLSLQDKGLKHYLTSALRLNAYMDTLFCIDGAGK